MSSPSKAAEYETTLTILQEETLALWLKRIPEINPSWTYVQRSSFLMVLPTSLSLCASIAYSKAFSKEYALNLLIRQLKALNDAGKPNNPLPPHSAPTIQHMMTLLSTNKETP